MSRKVVFIHGMFVGPRCWDRWVERYTAAGIECVAPAWPGRDLPVDELRRRHPDPALGALTLDAVIAHHEELLRAMNPKPVLVGHSMGGLLVQLLLQRDLGACGVAIDPAPPRGVVSLAWSFLKSNLPVVNPFAGDTPYLMPFEHFQYTFVNGMAEADQRAAYDANVVPESRRVARGPTGPAGAVDFKRPRAPLLITAGENDNIVPASLNESNYKKYAGSGNVTEFEVFPGRTHYLVAQRGWEEVADRARSFFEAHAR